MNAEKYEELVLSVAERSEDAKVLLGLVCLLEGASSEEALTRNFTALRGEKTEERGGEEAEERAKERGKELLRFLRKKKILGRGPFDEYISLPGYENVFSKTVAGFLLQPGDLSEYLENVLKTVDGDGERREEEKEEEEEKKEEEGKGVEEEKKERRERSNAVIKIIELLLKIDIHGVSGFTQYDIIKPDMCDMFSPAIFRSVEDELISKKLCVYGKKRKREFLKLCSSSAEIKDAKERIEEWRRKKLTTGGVPEIVEKRVKDLVAGVKKGTKEWKAKFAEVSKFSKEDLEKVGAYFSGFKMEENFLFLTGDLLVGDDTLHLVITDRLSRYDVREWRRQPVLFITEVRPRWLQKIEVVFRGAYPKLSERRVAVAVPNEVAYSNFKQDLLYDIVERLGIPEVLGLKSIPTQPVDHTFY